MVLWFLVLKRKYSGFLFCFGFFFKFVFFSKRLKKEVEKVCIEGNEKSWDLLRENKGINVGWILVLWLLVLYFLFKLLVILLVCW